MSKININVKNLLSNMLGIEPEDIEDDASLSEDLHMTPTDLTDFMEILSNNGFETAKLDLTEIETFGELNEKLTEPV